jgi:hypothetical protein
MRVYVPLQILLAMGTLLCANSMLAEVTKNSAVVRTVRPAGGASYSTDKGQTWKTLSVGSLLEQGATIKTTPNTVVDLFLGDNGPVVRLSENTRLSIDRLVRENVGQEKVIETLLDLEWGRILGNVKKLAAASRYEVKMTKGIVSIRGTQYDISSDGRVAVVNGGAAVTYSTVDLPVRFLGTEPRASYQVAQNQVVIVRSGQTVYPPTIAAATGTRDELEEGSTTSSPRTIFRRERLEQQLAVLRTQGPSDQREWLKPLFELAGVLYREHDLDAAAARCKEALAIGKDPSLELGEDRAELLAFLADVQIAQGKLEEAKASSKEVLTILRKFYPNDPARWEVALQRLAELLQKQGNQQEAQHYKEELAGISLHKEARELEKKADEAGREGKWQEAAADLARLVESHPEDHWRAFQLAPLLVQVGDLSGYEKHRHSMLARFSTTNKLEVKERVAKASLLLPISGGDLEVAAGLAEGAVSQGGNHAFFVWFQFAKALAEYRQEHFSSAAEWSRKVLAASGGNAYQQSQAHFILAMSQWRLGLKEEARASLAQGLPIVEKNWPKLEGNIGPNWQDILVVHIFMREAKSLIQGGGLSPGK